MRKLQIITFGKIKNAAIGEQVEYYSRLLGRFYELNFTQYKDVGERKVRLADFKHDGYLIALSEHGQTMDTPKLKDFWQKKVDTYDKINILIGNAYGLDTAVIEQADFVFSLSPLTLPHELAEVVLLEQIFRVSDMLRGGAYHK